MHASNFIYKIIVRNKFCNNILSTNYYYELFTEKYKSFLIIDIKIVNNAIQCC